MTQAGTSVDPNKNYLQHRALVLFSYFKCGISYAGTSVDPSKMLCHTEL